MSGSAAHAEDPTRPDFTLPDLDGTSHSISEWDGKVLAVNFWATWCSPCLKEIPEFVSMQNEFEARGLQFIGIAVEPDVGPVKDFSARLNMNYPILIGELEAMDVARQLGNDIGALPFTAVIDRDGKVVFIKQGTVSRAEATEVIAPLLCSRATAC
jgi:peroxiredoxin